MYKIAIYKLSAADHFHGSSFSDGKGKSWKVEHVVDFAKKNPAYLKKDFPISNLSHDMKYWQGDKARMHAADTSHPLLAVQEHDGTLSVADGLNRMKKMIDVEGKTHASVYVVPKAHIEHLAGKQ